MKRPFLILMVIFIVLGVGAEWALPSFVSERVKVYSTERLKAEEADIKLSSAPNIKMLLGMVDTLYIKETKVNLNGLIFQEIKSRRTSSLSL